MVSFRALRPTAPPEYSLADVTSVCITAAVVFAWIWVCGGAFSFLALLGCQVVFLAFYMVGTLVSAWRPIAGGVVFDLPLRLLVGYLADPNLARCNLWPGTAGSGLALRASRMPAWQCDAGRNRMVLRRTDRLLQSPVLRRERPAAACRAHHLFATTPALSSPGLGGSRCSRGLRRRHRSHPEYAWSSPHSVRRIVDRAHQGGPNSGTGRDHT
jgi:hypothetical protein